MSHQIFEREWRCRVFPAARLSERPFALCVTEGLLLLRLLRRLGRRHSLVASLEVLAESAPVVAPHLVGLGEFVLGGEAVGCP